MTDARSDAPVLRRPSPKGGGGYFRTWYTEWELAPAYRALPKVAQAVYRVLWTKTGGARWTPLSMQQVAYCAGTSRRQARRAVGQVQDAGLIYVRQSTGGFHGATNAYRARALTRSYAPREGDVSYVDDVAGDAVIPAVERRPDAGPEPLSDAIVGELLDADILAPALEGCSTVADVRARHTPAELVALAELAGVVAAPAPPPRPPVAAPSRDVLAAVLADARWAEVLVDSGILTPEQLLEEWGAETVWYAAAEIGIARPEDKKRERQDVAVEVVEHFLRYWRIDRRPHAREVAQARQFVGMVGSAEAWRFYERALGRLVRCVGNAAGKRPQVFGYLLIHLQAVGGWPRPPDE